MSICIYTKINKKTNLFEKTIYKNFIHLAQHSELKHTEDEIHRLMTSQNLQLYLYVLNNKIIAYLIGEIMTLNDGRTVLYITYIYTGSKYRGKGYGSKLMDTAEDIGRQKKADGILLTCDTEDRKVFDFYSKRGFMLDFKLRQYTKYDVLYYSF